MLRIFVAVPVVTGLCGVLTSTSSAQPKTKPYTKVDEVQGSKTLVGAQVAFSPDGMRVALFNPKRIGGKTTSQVAIWDFKEKKVVQRLESKGGLGHRLAWSADGSTFLTGWFSENFGSKDPYVLTVWDTTTWKEKVTFNTFRFSRFSVSGDGSVVAVGIPGEAVFLDVAKKKIISKVRGGKRSSSPDVVLSSDGKTAVVNNVVMNMRCSLVDTKTGRVKRSFPLGVYPFALSNDGKTLVASHTEGTFSRGKSRTLYGVVVYNTRIGAKSQKKYLFDRQGTVDHLGLLDKGSLAVFAGSGDEVRVLDIKSGKIAHRFTPLKGKRTVNMLVSADSSRILVVCGDMRTRIYSTPFGPK